MQQLLFRQILSQQVQHTGLRAGTHGLTHQLAPKSPGVLGILMP